VQRVQHGVGGVRGVRALWLFCRWTYARSVLSRAVRRVQLWSGLDAQSGAQDDTSTCRQDRQTRNCGMRSHVLVGCTATYRVCIGL
jgi:hypothetical protein